MSGKTVDGNYRVMLSYDSKIPAGVAKEDQAVALSSSESSSCCYTPLSISDCGSREIFVPYMGLTTDCRKDLGFILEERTTSFYEVEARRIRRGTVVGGFLCMMLALLLLLYENDHEVFHSPCAGRSCTRIRNQWFDPAVAIQFYLDLFDLVASKAYNETNYSSSLPQATRRTTEASSSSRNHDATLVIAGKMTVEEGPCNIAQYDLKTGEWSLTERIQLSLYNSYSGGEVYNLLANHTIVQSQSHPSTSLTNSLSETGARTRISSISASQSSPTKEQVGSGELIVVGAFDTTYRNSQVTYCSVGMWNGLQLSKVGEGLCNSALSKGMKITTAALAGPQDVYVAGSFQTQVWNGERHEFVKIFNIAHFNAVEQVWMPLNVGQITCSWCTVTVLALAWDSKRRQLHVAGKFNAVDGRNVPAGLAVYDYDTGHLVAHPGGGLSMRNISQDGVGTALQLDEESGVLYVMGSFERLTASYEICEGLAAYEIDYNRWTCLADAKHTVQPSGGGNMLLTPYGLMVAGKTTSSTTWPDSEHPYTIALLKAALRTREHETEGEDEEVIVEKQHYHEFNWTWLPGFMGHDEPLHALANGFGSFDGTVFVAGDNLVAKWSYELATESTRDEHRMLNMKDYQPVLVPIVEVISDDSVRGAIMAISQMMPKEEDKNTSGGGGSINVTIVVYCVSIGCVLGVIGALLCNRNISAAVFPLQKRENEFRGFTLDTLTYNAIENPSLREAYERAMKTRHVQHAQLLTTIDPKEIEIHRIIGEGNFGRVWSARWGTASVAVKEFGFAQAAVAGKSVMQQEIIEEIIGEAGMMAILRHPNVLQLFGCCLTAQAIWIVSELCSLGSLRQLLDDNDRILSVETRINLILQVAEGMAYLHSQIPPILHRDLKSHNIFVHETFTNAEDSSVASEKQNRGRTHNDQYEKMDTHSTIIAKIGDWGSARATLSGSKTMTHGVGTACWLAPEVINHARASEFSDVYGFGIILWELATREEVYQGLETTQIIAKVANENLRPPVPLDCPWKDIMVKCWAENPQDRLRFIDIIKELHALMKRMGESS
jgi:hypothetical protein